MNIRKITINDTLGVYNVLKTTWLNTYPNKKHGIKKSVIIKKFDDNIRIPKLENRIKKFGNNSQGWLYEIEGKIVGVGIIDITENKLELSVLYVLPEYQGKGIGKQLLDIILEYLKNHNKIELSVAIYNENAINFYKKNGFEIVEGSEGKHLIMDDVYIPTIDMKKPITN